MTGPPHVLLGHMQSLTLHYIFAAACGLSSWGHTTHGHRAPQIGWRLQPAFISLQFLDEVVKLFVLPGLRYSLGSIATRGHQCDPDIIAYSGIQGNAEDNHSFLIHRRRHNISGLAHLCEGETRRGGNHVQHTSGPMNSHIQEISRNGCLSSLYHAVLSGAVSYGK